MIGVPSLHKAADTSAPLHPLLAERWSPRGFDPTHTVDDHQLTSLFEAARWAPSANNSQPWRFVVARRGEEDFDLLAGVLSPPNRAWAPNAGALILVTTQTVDDGGRPRPWALYDAGQAVAALTLQAQAEGLSVHQMGGFDVDAARRTFGLDDTLTPVVVVAVGKLDPSAQLPAPLASREQAPRTREPLASLVLTGPAGLATGRPAA